MEKFESLIGEEMALESAFRFLVGYPVWNDNDQICNMDGQGLDGNLVWLTREVLFGPAVAYVATGKIV
jgi:hypothetical protein